MKHHSLTPLLLAAPLLLAMQAAEPTAEPAPLSPYDIVDQAAADDWRPIAPENLLIMTLADGAQVFLELAPDFAPVHVENIRELARAHWYDAISINRVQDNYVVQWGDPEGEEADAKPLPEGIVAQPPAEYDFEFNIRNYPQTATLERGTLFPTSNDGYSFTTDYANEWPVAFYLEPVPAESTGQPIHDGSLVHCYGMVGVGRGDNPDTGTGAELYTVIGHAPRHLDRNIALVGRIVEGIEHLSSLPRGTGPLGFYEDPAQRVGIATVRLASELPLADRPHFEVMRTDTETFRRYVTARANRTGWFVRPAGAVDVCNVNLPIRRASSN